MASVPRVALGVGLPLEGPVNDLLDATIQAERLGYSFLWANDDRLQKDVFTILSALALKTERIRLGPGVTNPTVAILLSSLRLWLPLTSWLEGEWSWGSARAGQITRCLGSIANRRSQRCVTPHR